jgi:exonuclease III
MDNNRYTKVLFWNISGINSKEKWDAISDKINESAYHILCLQETKREVFDPLYPKKFCLRSLDSFAFSASIGAFGGLQTVCNSNLFDGIVVQSNSYAITIKLLCRTNKKCIHITNVYGPSNPTQKMSFATWLMNLETENYENWVLGGDFNLIRNPENRNINQVVIWER